MKRQWLAIGRPLSIRLGWSKRSISLAAALVLLTSSLTACSILDLIPKDSPTPIQSKKENPGQENGQLPECKYPPGPCTVEEFEQEQVFEEAKNVYLEFEKHEFETLVLDEVPKEQTWIDQLAVEAFKQDLDAWYAKRIEATHRLESALGSKAKSTIRQLENPDREGTLIALEVCMDASDVEIVAKGTEAPIGRKHGLHYRRLFLKRVSGKMMIFYALGERREACPFQEGT